MWHELTRRDLLRGGVLTGAVAAARAAAGRLFDDPGAVPGPRTTVAPLLGKPTFFLDGAPFTSPVFETYVPEPRYFRQLAGVGCRVFSFSTNLSLGFRPATWLGPDRWDFSDLDTLAHRVLDARPDGLIMPRILLETPDWWLQQHPEEVQVLDDGRRVYHPGSESRSGRSFPSIASLLWRRDMAAGLQHLIDHLQRSDYAAHLFGYMITGMMTEEWYHWSIHSGQLSDYSAPMHAAFRAWLRSRYGDVAALREAWRDPRVEFSTAAVPSKADRQRHRERTFRDPAAEMPVIDYYLFYNEIIPETIDHFAGAVKEVSRGTKVVGAYYGYMFEFGGDPEFGHNALGRLARSKNLDFMLVTSSYGHRQLGRGADYLRSPALSLALHGKLWYHDNDVVSSKFPDVIRRLGLKEGFGPGTIQQTGENLGATKTTQETAWMYRRNAGFALGHGLFQSFFDLHGGYYDDPEILRELARLYRVLGESARFDRSSAAQILLVADETTSAYLTFENAAYARSLAETQPTLAKIGAPIDSVLVDDLDRLDPSPYRLIVFFHTDHLTKPQRTLIRRKLLRPGTTALWLDAPGLFDGRRESVESMAALTGLHIEAGEPSRPVAPRIELTRADHPLIAALREAGLSTLGPSDLKVRAFGVRDPGATVLGTLPGSDLATLAVKTVGGVTSFYAVTSLLPPVFYRAVARLAGVHLYNDRDDTLYASRSYLTLNADGPGPRTLRLPRHCDVIDPFEGRALHRGVDTFTVELRDKETMLVRLAPPG